MKLTKGERWPNAKRMFIIRKDPGRSELTLRAGRDTYILRWRSTFWRELDSEHPSYGVEVWGTGGEVSVGHRLYRWRYPWARD